MAAVRSWTRADWDRLGWQERQEILESAIIIYADLHDYCLQRSETYCPACGQFYDGWKGEFPTGTEQCDCVHILVLDPEVEKRAVVEIVKPVVERRPIIEVISF